jgi:hypothetical protein
MLELLVVQAEVQEVKMQMRLVDLEPLVKVMLEVTLLVQLVLMELLEVVAEVLAVLVGHHQQIVQAMVALE